MKSFGWFVAMVCVFQLSACQTVMHDEYQPIEQTTIKTSNSTLIVFYKTGKKDEVLALFNTLNVTVIYDYKNINGFAIGVNANELESVKRTLENHPNILGVNDDGILGLH